MTNSQLHNALFELVLNIGTSSNFKESANTALLSYIQQLDCLGIILYENIDNRCTPILYKPRVLQKDDSINIIFEDFLEKIKDDSNHIFKDNLPLIISKNEKEYYFYKLENFGYLLFINNISGFDAHIIKALRIVNDKFAKSLESCRNLEKIIQKDEMLFRQSKMATMGEVIENITHQWKQPLSLISSTASGINLLIEYGKFDERELKPLLNDIVDKTKYLSQTIDDFKSYFDNDLSKNSFLVKPVILKTADFLSSRLKRNDIEFIINNINDTEIYSYKNQLMQIIMNILNNAIDEFENKNIDKKFIIIDIYEEKDFISILIKDNAFGVPIEILDKIFNPYFTSKEKDKGTGLGLYMAKNILEKNFKGTLSVKNVDFKINDVSYTGAEFTLKIPIK